MGRLQKRRKQEYQLGEANRKIQLAEAKTRLARERRTNKIAEKEIWQARREKWRDILGPPKGTGRKIKVVGKGLVRGAKRGTKVVRRWMQN